MPKRRKSLAELAETGSLDKNRGRLATRILAQSVTAVPVGRAPKHLPPAERKIWAELTDLAPPNVLSRSDRISVEVACFMLTRLRTGIARTSEVALLSSLLGKLGMSPSDRARLNIKPQSAELTEIQDDDPWAEFD